MSKRLSWIDVMKGVGMLLVIFGHASLPNEVRKYIYSFHMPLFFCISGYLFNIKKYDGFNQFLKSKAKSLLIPYIFLSVLNYCYYFILKILAHKFNEISLKPLIGVLVGIRDTEWTMCNGTMWFVLALFFCEIILFYIVKLLKDRDVHILISLLVFAVIGFFYNSFINIKLPFSIDEVFVSITFVGLGYIIKKRDLVSKFNSKIYIILFITLNFVFQIINTQVNLFDLECGNYIYFYISAISGIMMVMIICKNINKSKFLEFIGKNTLLLLSIHQFVIYNQFKRIYDIIQINDFTLILLAITYTVLTLIILYIPIVFVNKYCPFIVGKNRITQ